MAMNDTASGYIASMTTRVVLVTGDLPYDNPGHAGGVYAQHVHLLAAANASVTVIAPDSPSNRLAAAAPGSPERTLLTAYPMVASPQRRAVEAAMFRLDCALRLRLIGLPSYFICRALLSDSPERRAVQQADVVDLQWSEAIRLAPIIRRLNARTRIVGTFHDVKSQVHERLVASDQAATRMRRVNAWQLEKAEQNALERLDDVVVFSEKDAALLGARTNIRIIRPPLAAEADRREHAVPPGLVAIMVSALSRPENDEAAIWLLTHVWPRVISAEPDARLRLIGGGASTELVRLAQQVAGVELAGFVETLEPEYARARVAVVPLLRGAGVKFKTIEALVRGVPVVATPVGAEGIGAAGHYTACSNDPADLANGIHLALRDPASAQRRADEARQWAIETYGYDQFFLEVQRSYAVREWTRPATG